MHLAIGDAAAAVKAASVAVAAKATTAPALHAAARSAVAAIDNAWPQAQQPVRLCAYGDYRLQGNPSIEQNSYNSNAGSATPWVPSHAAGSGSSDPVPAPPNLVDAELTSTELGAELVPASSLLWLDAAPSSSDVPPVPVLALPASGSHDPVALALPVPGQHSAPEPNQAQGQGGSPASPLDELFEDAQGTVRFYRTGEGVAADAADPPSAAGPMGPTVVGPAGGSLDPPACPLGVTAGSTTRPLVGLAIDTSKDTDGTGGGSNDPAPGAGVLTGATSQKCNR